ncbi:PKD domain-containing protein [Mangrovivirga cuniculi]|uniref:PKD domain-containing protein n=1 Tax=Mangrovivirga cuniculi TaxID=2715131 RepID=A0A4D7K0L2_9BACT|nr:PKD domain-containing protein [Mangrovivirga cuniculi]QCK16485.1 hypothetical protein DCC35_17990 [Mangrovivirga cuniculi]
MNKYFFIILLYSTFSIEVFGQCDDISFTIDDNICIHQNFAVELDDEQLSEYSIDFTAGDFLDNDYSAEGLITNNDFYRARSIKIVEDDGMFFGFALSQTNNKLLRLNFGSSLENTPQISYLENVESEINRSFGFDIVESKGIWNIIVANTGGDNLLRIKFNQGLLSNDIAISKIAIQSSIDSPNNIKIIKTGNDIFAAVSCYEEVLMLKFQDEITDEPQEFLFEVGRGHTLRGIDIVEECGSYTGYVLSYTKEKILKLNYGSNLMDIPNIETINLTGSRLRYPATIDIEFEVGGYYAFIQGALGNTYKINLGYNLGQLNYSNEELDLPTSSQGFGLEMVKDKSDWSLFLIDLKNRELVRVKFSSDSSAGSPVFYSSANNLINNYNNRGSKYLILNYLNNSGYSGYIIDSTYVSGLVSPNVFIKSDSISCTKQNIDFSASSESNLNSWNWQFGDGNTASGQSISHQYTADGAYPIRLDVTDANTGCSNIAFDTISIYQQPIANFSSDQTVVCSNTDLLFENQSILNGADDFASYQWYLNDNLVTNNTNYTEKIELPGIYSVSLKTTIPGCYDSISKEIEIKEGPKSDFSFAEACENSFVSFNNLSSGSNIVSRKWDFDNGVESNELNPDIFFEKNGYYNISLTLTNESGCVNTKFDSLYIHDVPRADFSTSLACDNIPVKFTDRSGITGDEISSWQWLVNDTEKYSIRNPNIDFDSAGNYKVELKVKSSFGCESNTIKNIEINKSPNPDFDIENACSESFVSFSHTKNQNASDIKSWLWTIQGEEYLGESIEKFYSAPGEYSVKLNVIANNLCSEDTVKQFTIKQSPTVNFEVENPCEGEETILRSSTENVTDYNWIVDDNIILSGKESSWIFSQSGNKPIQHVVTAENGCKDTLTKEININRIPEVVFSVSNTEGGVPFLVELSNESRYAETFKWNFEGGNRSISYEFEPSHLYEFRGDYTIELTGYSKDSCTASSSLNISAVNPVVDIELNEIELIEIDGENFLEVKVSNIGNIPVRNLFVSVELSNGEVFQKFLKEKMKFNTSDSFTFPINHDLTSVKNLCVEVSYDEVEREINKYNNSQCITFNSGLSLIGFTKNPSRTDSYLKITSPNNEIVLIQVLDSKGSKALEFEYELKEGLNHIPFKATQLSPGVYPVNISNENIKTSVKFIKQ